MDWVTTYPFMCIWPEASGFTGHPTKKGDVVIGNDVWVGRCPLFCPVCESVTGPSSPPEVW